MQSPSKSQRKDATDRLLRMQKLMQAARPESCTAGRRKEIDDCKCDDGHLTFSWAYDGIVDRTIDTRTVDNRSFDVQVLTYRALVHTMPSALSQKRAPAPVAVVRTASPSSPFDNHIESLMYQSPMKPFVQKPATPRKLHLLSADQLL